MKILEERCCTNYKSLRQRRAQRVSQGFFLYLPRE